MSLLILAQLLPELSLHPFLPALHYGTEAILPIRGAAEVRMQAAALGKLKTAYRRNDIAQRICELLGTQRNSQVLDGLYNALLSLASAPEQE